MPKVKANKLVMNYEQQGSGEPLVLIRYLAADYACYAFQVAEYAKHFTCISLDLRGAGETDKPEGVYSTELFADAQRSRSPPSSSSRMPSSSMMSRPRWRGSPCRPRSPAGAATC